jgi:hypothetical protein
VCASVIRRRALGLRSGSSFDENQRRTTRGSFRSATKGTPISNAFAVARTRDKSGANALLCKGPEKVDIDLVRRG